MSSISGLNTVIRLSTESYRPTVRTFTNNLYCNIEHVHFHTQCGAKCPQTLQCIAEKAWDTSDPGPSVSIHFGPNF